MDNPARTASTCFSQQRRKTANNNHIKIRTVCYSTTTSTAADSDKPWAYTTDDFGDRANLATQFIWLRKPVGIPTQLQATTSQKSFGLRSHTSMAGFADRANKTATEGFQRTTSEGTFGMLKTQTKQSAHQRSKKTHDPFFLEFVKAEYLGEKENPRRIQDRQELLVPIPDESKIKERFRMRIPVRVDAIENNFSTIHVFEQPQPGINTIRDHEACIKRDLALLRKQEDKMRDEMKAFGDQQNAQLDQMKALLLSSMSDFRKRLREDSIDHQNSQVAMHKDIQKLKNMREDLISGLTTEYERAGKVEDKLFKAQVFDLQTDDKDLQDYDKGILRREHEPLLGELQRIKNTSNAYELSKHKKKKIHLFD
jgi:hypothetical protein